MTKKDFTLIQDAINASIREFFENKALRYDLDNAVTVDKSLGLKDKLFLPRRIEIHMRIHLAKQFAERLRYTNDAFNADRFQLGITGASKVVNP